MKSITIFSCLQANNVLYSPLMMRKLCILMLVFSLATAATATEWLLPVTSTELSQPGSPDEAASDAPPQHYFEPLQLLPVHLSGLQIRAEWPQTLPAAPVVLSEIKAAGNHQRLPEALIHRQKVLLTCTMQAQAP
jgi:hypothetical protein